VMALNNLLAAPGFAAWMEGEALDIGQMLHTPGGKPRVCIFSIAHLSDAERMFFVSLLLTQVLGWMRSQSGTTSLRALLYMDEIFGYFPPVANPPSKLPLLTLLKQARAFGLGVVLATQNPVDLDYKGLSNAGTWFLGRLQTERDKARVLEGLEGAAATAGSGFNRQRMEQILAGLGPRIFLMNNTHDDAPEVFQTRWAMSYLRGPMTRNQIKTLMDPYKASQAYAAAGPQAVAQAVAASVKRVAQLLGETTSYARASLLLKSFPGKYPVLVSTDEAGLRLESPLKPEIITKPGEQVVFALSPIELIGTKTVYEGAGGRVTVKIVPGVYLSGGGGRGESHEERVVVDTGDLVFTDKRLLFTGSNRTIALPWSKLVDLDDEAGELKVAGEGRERTLLFSGVEKTGAFVRVGKRPEESCSVRLTSTRVAFLVKAAILHKYDERQMREQLLDHFPGEDAQQPQPIREYVTMTGISPVNEIPALPPDVPQYFLPVRGSAPVGSTLTYQPMVLGAARVNFVEARARVDFTQESVCLTPVTNQPIPVDWEVGQETDVAVADLEKVPQTGGRFVELPAAASKTRSYAGWERDFVTWLYGSQKLELFKSPSLGELSQPGETERDFRVRLQQAARESRDAAAEKLRAKYAPKIATLKERVRRAEQAVEREAEQAKAQKVQTAISFGSTVLGAFVGRRAVSGTLGRATTAARGVSRSMKEQQDVGRAEETVGAIQQRLADLETEFKSEMDLLEAKIDPQAETLEPISIRPKKTNIAVQLLALAWAPYWQAKEGEPTPAY